MTNTKRRIFAMTRHERAGLLVIAAVITTVLALAYIYRNCAQHNIAVGKIDEAAAAQFISQCDSLNRSIIGDSLPRHGKLPRHTKAAKKRKEPASTSRKSNDGNMAPVPQF